jgi:DNA-binding NarL/FixJ family response regulator
MEVTVLMVDDHPPIIEGYKSILAFNPLDYTVKTKEVFDCESAYNLIVSPNIHFDLIFLDLTLPPYADKKINSGEDLIPVIRKHLPNTKVVVLTSHTESLLLHGIIKEHQPEGLLVKSEIQSAEFTPIFDSIIRGNTYYSATVKNTINSLKTVPKFLDNYNRRIILLLSKGLKTKTIQEELHLSKSAIDKRKVIIKDYLGIEKGNDEDLLREARKQGLI